MENAIIHFDRACRSCLREDGEMQSLYVPMVAEAVKPCLNLMLIASTQLEVNEKDGMPRQICSDCTIRLEHAFSFKHMCVETDRKLKRYMQIHRSKETLLQGTNVKVESGNQNSVSNNEIIDFSTMFNSDMVAVKQESRENAEGFSKNEPLVKANEKCVQADLDDVHECIQCNKKFRTLFGYKVHVKNHFKLACSKCDKLFVNEASLKEHKRSHKKQSEKLECPLCQARHSSADSLIKHFIVHKKTTNYTCENCNRTFSKSSSYERHTSFCNEDKKHHCTVCTKSFDTSKALVLHNELIHGKIGSDDDASIKEELEGDAMEIPLKTLKLRANGLLSKSPPNPYVFESIMEPVVNIKEEPIEVMLEDEMDDNDADTADFQVDYDSDDEVIKSKKKSKKLKEENGENKYGCTYCGLTFSRASGLKRHESSHKEMKQKFTCDYCPKTFKRRDHMRRHKWQHAESKPHICEVCNKGFGRLEHLAKHKESRHSVEVKDKEKNPKSVLCTICSKAFTTLKYLEIHMRIHQVDKGITCKRCEKSFDTKFDLKEHKKTHAADKPFLCTECGQSFIKNEYLIVHMRRHRGEKPFKCRFCDKGFFRTTDLVAHERYHTEEKTHLCTICGKGFQRQYNLTVHLRVHTGEKPYACSYCDKRFAQGNDLKSHVRRHTGERFKCEVCGEGFIQGYHLTQHKRTVHGIESTQPVRRVVKHPMASLLNPPPVPKTARSRNTAKKQMEKMAALAAQLQLAGTAVPVFQLPKPVVASDVPLNYQMPLDLNKVENVPPISIPVPNLDTKTNQ